MFCPVCKAEYRQGITTCADCQVGLVSTLPANGSDAPAIDQGRLVPLWEGEDLALHASLLEALDAAKIPYFNKPLSIYPGVRRADPFPVQPLTQFGFKVAVLEFDLPAAQRMLDTLQTEHSTDLELQEAPESPAASAPARSSSNEEPTSEIWRGEDEGFARFLRDALRENDLPVREEAAANQIVIFVRPSDSPRAKEIIRELTDASPPL